VAKAITSLSMKDTQVNQVKHDEILDRLRQLEAKFIVLCRLVFGISSFGINFKVTNWGFDYEKEYVKVASTSGSPGTSSNPIFLKEEMEADTKGKAKMHEIFIHAGPDKPPPIYVNVYAIIIVLCISIDKSIIKTRSLRNTHSQETQHLSWETL
jgi:hypothetical protein